MTDENDDITEEVREQSGESDSIEPETDGDSGAILTLDGDDTPPDGGREATRLVSDGDEE